MWAEERFEIELSPSVRISCREYRDEADHAEAARPLLFLHGGWGYRIYPFESQIEVLAEDYRVLIPDRSGYGRSGRLERFPPNLHQEAADETLALLDALGIERAVLWGHSDGAVNAGRLALDHPGRVEALILEATHFLWDKPRSREFFATMVREPERYGERVVAALREEHGADYWRQLLANEGRAWLDILDGVLLPHEDLFDGRLDSLAVPVMFLHGADDPRTEPDELAAIRAQLPDAPMHVLAGAGHSPHSERGSEAECTRLAAAFLKRPSGS